MADSITLQGGSGAKYTFELYPWGTTFKPVAGVYAVLRRDPDGYAVIYVGETRDLSERLQNHEHSRCFVNHGRTHIAVHQKSVERDRLAIEQDLIASYQPPCNQQK
jgi:excinuclease UvrABC nuclease subunit